MPVAVGRHNSQLSGDGPPRRDFRPWGAVAEASTLCCMPETLPDLTRDECWSLLCGFTVGRVVYTDSALPACTPVTYRLIDDTLMFRVPSGSRMAAATRNTVVALQVDPFAAGQTDNWSVLVTGVTRAVVDAETLRRLERCQPPRRFGSSGVWVSLIPSVVTGRRLDPLAVPVPAA